MPARQDANHSTPRSDLLCVPGGPVVPGRGSIPPQALPFVEAVTKVFGAARVVTNESSREKPTREEKMKTTNEVLSFAPSSNKPGAWLKMKVKDDKGVERDAYLKDQALIPLITTPGLYEFEKQKNGQYWDIVGVRFLGAASPAAAAAHPAPGPIARASGSADMNVLIQNKAITAQVCVKAAVDLVGKAFEAGAFKSGDGAAVDFSSAADSAAILAASLMKEAGEFVRGKTGAPVNGAYKDDAGRTHEPVEGA